MKQTGLARSALLGAVLSVSPGLMAGNVSALAQSYQNMSCGDLWYARNAIYAEAGYCFKTARARSVFGPGCFPPHGKLSRSQQRQVDLITAQERRKGC